MQWLGFRLCICLCWRCIGATRYRYRYRYSHWWLIKWWSTSLPQSMQAICKTQQIQHCTDDAWLQVQHSHIIFEMEQYKVTAQVLTFSTAGHHTSMSHKLSCFIFSSIHDHHSDSSSDARKVTRRKWLDTQRRRVPTTEEDIGDTKVT